MSLPPPSPPGQPTSPDPSPPAPGPGPGQPSLAQRTKATGTALLTQLEERRAQSRLVDGGFRLFDLNRAVGGLVLAGAIAFRLFLFVVPYVFTMVVGIGLGAESASVSPAEAARNAGVAGLVAEALDDVMQTSRGFQVTALVTGLFATLWAARGLYRVLAAVHALVWRVPNTRPRRAWLPPLVVVAGVTGFLALNRGLGAVIGELGPVGKVLAVLTFGAAVTAFWTAASWHLPRAADVPTRRSLLPGAGLVALGMAMLFALSRYYFAARIERMSDSYGTLGISLAILGWASIIGWIITAGAQLNAALHEQSAVRTTAG